MNQHYTCIMGFRSTSLYSCEVQKITVQNRDQQFTWHYVLLWTHSTLNTITYIVYTKYNSSSTLVIDQDCKVYSRQILCIYHVHLWPWYGKSNWHPRQILIDLKWDLLQDMLKSVSCITEITCNFYTSASLLKQRKLYYILCTGTFNAGV